MIEVFADVWCPFAHVGLRTAVRRRDQLGRHDVVLRIRAWPLELVNGQALDPTTTSDHAEALRTQVAADLFSHFDVAHFPTTSLPALVVAAAAYRQDDRLGERVSLALRHAFFEEGRDISDPEVLDAIAAPHNVGPVTDADRAAVQVDWRAGQQLGVSGSPHFFCGTSEAYCPSLDIAQDRDDGHLEIGRNMGALDAFLADCFQL